MTRSRTVVGAFGILLAGWLRLFSLLILSGFALTGWGASKNLLHGVVGNWEDNPHAAAGRESWEARWIWAKEDLGAEMVHFRRRFQFGKAPESARLRITASSVYKLWINGEYICQGPARCAPHHQSYDDLDVSSILRQGENVIAVRVHYQEGTVSYHHEGRAGLLLQLDVENDGKQVTIGSDKDWKVLPDPAWDPESPPLSRFNLDLADRMDLRKAVRDWEALKFDDSKWKPAQVLRRKVGWPLPQKDSKSTHLVPPWTGLDRRDIPYLREESFSQPKLILALPVGEDGFAFSKLPEEKHRMLKTVEVVSRSDHSINLDRDSEGEWIVPPTGEDGVFLLFDFERVICGLPQLELQGAAGTEVDILCAPYLLEGRFTADILNSRLMDRIILSGDEDRWRAFYFKPTRYLGIVIRGDKKPTSLKTVGLHQLAYPFEMKGSFSSPENPWLEQCWLAAAKTIRVCTTDAYTDNYRERRQYVQTAYYAALGNAWAFGDTQLHRRCLKQAAEEQQANGIMPSYAPQFGDDFLVFLDSNTAWIRGLRDYLLYSGDETTARALLPAGRKLMDLFHSFSDEKGLIANPPFAYWLDHALIDRRGANFYLNGHYLGAVEDFAELLSWLGLEEEASIYRKRATRLRSSLRKLFWNAEKQLFCDALVDGKQSNMFSEHANGMALAVGVATNEQGKAIAEQLLVQDQHDFIRRESGLIMVTPASSYLLHLGLCRYGFVRESLAMFQDRFDSMLQQGQNGTLWEEWWLDRTGRNGKQPINKTRSDAQTESAFPPALFGEYVLGLSPMAPGLKQLGLSLHDCGLTRRSGTLPTPGGWVSVDWDLEKRTLKLEIQDDLEVVLALDSLPPRESKPITINQVPLNQKNGATTLTRGKHHVHF